jgi:hypothetical protein
MRAARVRRKRRGVARLTNSVRIERLGNSFRVHTSFCSVVSTESTVCHFDSSSYLISLAPYTELLCSGKRKERTRTVSTQPGKSRPANTRCQLADTKVSRTKVREKVLGSYAGQQPSSILPRPSCDNDINELNYSLFGDVPRLPCHSL